MSKQQHIPYLLYISDSRLGDALIQLRAHICVGLIYWIYSASISSLFMRFVAVHVVPHYLPWIQLPIDTKAQSTLVWVYS